MRLLGPFLAAGSISDVTPADAATMTLRPRAWTGWRLYLMGVPIPLPRLFRGEARSLVVMHLEGDALVARRRAEESGDASASERVAGRSWSRDAAAIRDVAVTPPRSVTSP